MDERERVIPKQERGIKAGGVFFRQMAVLMEKKALSLVMVVALLATSFLQLRASMDFPAEDGEGSEGEACCDQCICTRSIPPQCRCTDVKSYCHSSCKGCLCTRSIPPQCRCTDIKDSCDNECTATGF